MVREEGQDIVNHDHRSGMCDTGRLVFQKEKEKKEKTIVDPFLGAMKRTVWTVYPSKRT